MVLLNRNRETEIINLPTLPGSEIEIYKNINVWTKRQIFEKHPKSWEKNSEDAAKAGFEMYVRMIKSWNLEANPWVILPITQEVLDDFREEDFNFLIWKINENVWLKSDKKK